MGNVSLGPLSLWADSLVPTHTTRTSSLDIPRARGSSIQMIGHETLGYTLQGVLTGDTRLSDYQQIERYRLLGRSLILDHPSTKGVVLIKTLKRVAYGINWLTYELGLLETRFKQIHAMDDLTYITAAHSASLTNSSPVPVEGYYCVKDSGTATGFSVTYNAPAPIDLSDFNYVSAMALLQSLTSLSEAHLQATDWSSNTGTVDVTNQLGSAGQFTKLIADKGNFTGGTIDWSQIALLIVEASFSGSVANYLAIDDLGAYE